MHCRLKLALKTVIHCSVLCFSFSLVVFFFCCNYTPLDGAARRRHCKTRTSPERKEASTVTKWPVHKMTLNGTERVRHRSLASPATTPQRRLQHKDVLEEKKSDNNYICHFAILPSGHGKFINIGGSHFFLTSPRALLETTCNVQKSIKRLKSLKYFNKFLAFTYFHPKIHHSG